MALQNPFYQEADPNNDPSRKIPTEQIICRLGSFTIETGNQNETILHVFHWNRSDSYYHFDDGNKYPLTSTTQGLYSKEVLI